MATKKTKPDKKAKGGARATAAPRPNAEETDKPPESAEDFEHTLRRLIAEKSRS